MSRLWKLMDQEHGITLLETEEADIRNAVLKDLGIDWVHWANTGNFRKDYKATIARIKELNLKVKL